MHQPRGSMYLRFTLEYRSTRRVLRLQNIGPNSMEIRLQEPRDSAAITPSDVHCIIAEEGAHTLPDGTNFEAHTVLSDATVGWNPGWATASLENVSGDIIHAYANPAVLGQVMTNNDGNFSTFYSNDCDNRRNRLFLSGMADGIVWENISVKTRGSPRARTKRSGNIVAESGTATVNGVQFQIGSWPRFTSRSDGWAGAPYSYP